MISPPPGLSLVFSIDRSLLDLVNLTHFLSCSGCTVLWDWGMLNISHIFRVHVLSCSVRFSHANCCALLYQQLHKLHWTSTQGRTSKTCALVSSLSVTVAAHDTWTQSEPNVRAQSFPCPLFNHGFLFCSSTTWHNTCSEPVTKTCQTWQNHWTFCCARVCQDAVDCCPTLITWICKGLSSQPFTTDLNG